MGDESRLNHEVFISYSSKDKQWADAACAVLERHRIRCWVAPRDITPGTEWGSAIISGLDASKIMVLIFSTHANQSAQVRREVERATSKGLIVLPFRVEDVSPAGSMEFALSNMHWLDGFTPPVERQLDYLASSVGSLLSKGGREATAPSERLVTMPSPVLRRLILPGLAVLCVIIAAGLFAMFRGGPVHPNSQTAPRPLEERPPQVPERARVADRHEIPPRPDQERIQGRWQAVEVVNANVDLKKAFAASINPVWTFQGTQLTVHGDPYAKDFDFHGSFSLSSGVERRLFGYNFKSKRGKSFDWLGIYKFDGELLRVCYESFPSASASDFKRPDSFVLTSGSKQVRITFRHLEDR
jgi:uncharacterized protein (TIGR03067 family)